MATFDLQGHRGARGLKPENTLPAFETALDLMVSTLECDLHLTRDRVPVLSHDAALHDGLVIQHPEAKAPPLSERPRISSLTLEQVRGHAVVKNPDRKRFPTQNAVFTPVAATFAISRQMPNVFTLPTLAELFAFVQAYAGEMGRNEKKTDLQRQRAGAVRFNIELKRVPFRPENIGDDFSGEEAGEFEKRVLEVLREAKTVPRTTIQSFDHRSVRAMRKLEPGVTGAALVENTALVSIDEVVRAADAQVYSPDFEFLDVQQIRAAHKSGVRVVPYTINDPDEMRRLIEWGVDGLITDFPDQLAQVLQSKHIAF